MDICPKKELPTFVFSKENNGIVDQDRYFVPQSFTRLVYRTLVYIPM